MANTSFTTILSTASEISPGVHETVNGWINIALTVHGPSHIEQAVLFVASAALAPAAIKFLIDAISCIFGVPLSIVWGMFNGGCRLLFNTMSSLVKKSNTRFYSDLTSGEQNHDDENGDIPRQGEVTSEKTNEEDEKIVENVQRKNPPMPNATTEIKEKNEEKVSEPTSNSTQVDLPPVLPVKRHEIITPVVPPVSPVKSDTTIASTTSAPPSVSTPAKRSIPVPPVTPNSGDVTAFGNVRSSLTPSPSNGQAVGVGGAPIPAPNSQASGVAEAGPNKRWKSSATSARTCQEVEAIRNRAENDRVEIDCSKGPYVLDSLREKGKRVVATVLGFPVKNCTHENYHYEVEGSDDDEETFCFCHALPDYSSPACFQRKVGGFMNP